MRRTKIVCTLGPASNSVDRIKQLLDAGMNVTRFNFSHGNHQEHAATVTAVRQAAAAGNYNLALLLDTQGPEIRTGTLIADKITLYEGQRIILTTDDLPGNEHVISVNYKKIVRDVTQGMKILLDDGLIMLEVVDVAATEVHCQVLNGGELSGRKGINIPSAHLTLPAVSEKDREDILFAIKNNFDYIAASFVRKASDILAIRAILEEHGSNIQIIAKIENQEGVDNLKQILDVADGIMVARGDLGVEIPPEDVPLIQKMIISSCNALGKPVITATQMLDSMIRNPRPTRAEASDVANAIFDGTDALMLSGETAVGRYPVEAVCTMARIAERTEAAIHSAQILECPSLLQQSVTDAISYATCFTAQQLGVRAIITATQSGHTARMVSKYKPGSPIIAATTCEQVARQLALTRGVFPVLIHPTSSTDEMFSFAIDACLKSGYINNGDLTVFTAGVPVGVSGTTNLLRVHTVGKIILQGAGVGRKNATGRVRIAYNNQDAAMLEDGEILVTVATDCDYVPYLERVAGLIVEEGGLTSHAAIVGLTLNKPVIVGARLATKMLKSGDIVTMDTTRGLVYEERVTIL